MTKLEIARAALRSAEEKYGLKSQIVRVGSQLRLARPGEVQVEDTWDVPASITSLFPTGFPRRGSVEVSGRTFLLLLASLLSAQGAWLAIVGMEDISWEFAKLLGMDVARTVRVDTHGNTGGLFSSVASAIDGFDVVLLSEGVRVDRREWERLRQRSLAKNALLIRESPENGAYITSRLSHIEGMHEGSGRLRSFTLELFGPYGRHSSLAIDERGIRPPVKEQRDAQAGKHSHEKHLRLVAPPVAHEEEKQEVHREEAVSLAQHTKQQKERRVGICSVASSSRSGH